MNLRIKFLNAMQIIIKVRMSDKVNRLRCHVGHEKEYDDNVITTSEIIFNCSLRKLRCHNCHNCLIKDLSTVSLWL